MQSEAELRKAADIIRRHWSFDGGQQHTHSWHDREDFIERVLPSLLSSASDAMRKRAEEAERERDELRAADRDHAAARAGFEKRHRDMVDAAEARATTAHREGWEAMREAATDAQPSTAENPNEDAYQRGRFDGVMEYGRAIRSLPESAIPALDTRQGNPEGRQT